MARIVVVSNRVPSPRDRLARAGGLAVALRNVLQRHGGLWFGWSGETAENPATAPQLTAVGQVTYATLDLTPADYEAYYVAYANSTLWPLCHYRLGLIEFRRGAFAGYQRVNTLFAQALAELLDTDDIVWVHDYHLIPLGAELRRMGVRNKIGFFLHVPFPAKEVFCALPDHLALARALAHYDLIGLQTHHDVGALLDYFEGEADAKTSNDGRVTAFDRHTRVAAFPIGIDTEGFATAARETETTADTKRLKESLRGRSLVLGVDRLDYSKGLPKKIEAFGQLLERWTEHRSHVVFMQISPTSRDTVAQYRALRREVEAVAGRLNGKYAEFDWAPVRYLNKSFSRRIIAGFYRTAQVGFVAPLRDGMNLVAKEYVAAQDPADPGVLVLSRFAGAADELKSALIVNPFDTDAVADALHRGLTMPLAERRDRWEALYRTLRSNNIDHWCDSFLRTLTGGGDDAQRGKNAPARIGARPMSAH